MSQIKICDWCKKQIKGRRQRGFLQLTDKKGTGKKGQKATDKSVVTSAEYDLCDTCYGEIGARLQAAMVLPPVTLNDRPRIVDPSVQDMSPEIDTNMSRKEWVVMVEEEKISPKAPVIEGEPVPVQKRGRTKADKKEGFVSPVDTNIKCPHYNKNKIVIPSDEVSRPYQMCRDCGKRVEYSKKDASMSLDSGVAFHDKN
jgi:transcription elongation factor Elf1